MDADKISSMLREVLAGVSKDSSRFVTDEESSQLWDSLTSEVEAIKEAHPDAVIEVPGELPDSDEMDAVVASAATLDTEEPAIEPWASLVDESEDTLTAAAASAPMRPPREWFDDPKLGGPTPLTVDDDGHVYGHLALWDTCHTGHAHTCIQPPRSRSDYAYFHNGVVHCEDGTKVAVGHITLDTGHAGETLTPDATLAHYDNTGKQVADVHVGEDRHGIWVSGAVRPGLGEKALRVLRSSPLSGDWRRIKGNLELLAALAVNVGGFPIPRPKGMVASGALQSLVASGMVAPRKLPDPVVAQQLALSEHDLKYLRKLADRERLQHVQSLATKLRQDRDKKKIADMASRLRAGKEG